MFQFTAYEGDASDIPPWFRRVMAGRGLSRALMIPRTYAIAGDSIMEVHTVFNSTNSAFGSRGCVNWAMEKLGWPLEFLTNAAVAGATVSEIRDYIRKRVMPFRPGYCFFNGGWNDLGSQTGDTIATGVIDICKDLMNEGTVPIYIGPHANTTYNSQARREQLSVIRNKVEAWARRNGAIFIDTWSVTLDASTGNEISSTTVDGLHPNTRMAYAIGTGPLADALASILPAEKPPTYSVDPYNTCQNAIMLGSNATGSGGYTRTTFSSGNGPNGCQADTSNATGTVTAPAARSDGKAGNVWVQSPTMSAAHGWGRLFQIIRWETAWAATTAYTFNNWRIPTVDNGWMYIPIVAGNSGSSEPTWPTTQGATVVDGTVTWQAFRQPVENEQWYAEWEILQNAITSGSGMPTARLIAQNSGGSALHTAWAHYYDTGNANEAYPTVALATQYLRTPVMKVPAACKRFSAEFRLQGANSAQLVAGLAALRVMRYQP